MQATNCSSGYVLFVALIGTCNYTTICQGKILSNNMQLLVTVVTIRVPSVCCFLRKYYSSLLFPRPPPSSFPFPSLHCCHRIRDCLSQDRSVKLAQVAHPVVYNQATCDTKLKCWCSHYHMVNRKLTVSMQILGKQIRTLAMLVLRAHFKLVLFLTTLHSLVFMLYSARLM